MLAEGIARYRLSGPRDTTSWLLDGHLDGVLSQWALEFPDFFHCGYANMDFANYKCQLRDLDLAAVWRGEAAQTLLGGAEVRRPCRTFACVLNTDTHRGPGEHWVVLFADMRDRAIWSLEFFNSTGKPDTPEVATWMNRAAAQLGSLPACPGVRQLHGSSIVHQHSNTECGLYVLFYVRARLEGVPASYFRDHRVPDQAMRAFRRHLFRA